MNNTETAEYVTEPAVLAEASARRGSGKEDNGSDGSGESLRAPSHIESAELPMADAAWLRAVCGTHEPRWFPRWRSGIVLVTRLLAPDRTVPGAGTSAGTRRHGDDAAPRESYQPVSWRRHRRAIESTKTQRT